MASTEAYGFHPQLLHSLATDPMTAMSFGPFETTVNHSFRCLAATLGL